MTFFFDNDISIKLVRALREVDQDVVHLQEVFAETTPDIIWLELVGNEGWFLVTHDKNIRKNKAEREALKRYGVGAFFLAGSSMSTWDRVKQVVRAWEKMQAKTVSKTPPFAFVVRRAGRTMSEVHID